MYNTRIDNGDVENSLHGVNIRVENEDKVNIENNIGKMVTFTIANEKAYVRTKFRGSSLMPNA